MSRQRQIRRATLLWFRFGCWCWWWQLWHKIKHIFIPRRSLGSTWGMLLILFRLVELNALHNTTKMRLASLAYAPKHELTNNKKRSIGKLCVTRMLSCPSAALRLYYSILAGFFLRCDSTVAEVSEFSGFSTYYSVIIFFVGQWICSRLLENHIDLRWGQFWA